MAAACAAAAAEEAERDRARSSVPVVWGRESALDAEQDTPVNSGGGEGGVPPAEWDVVYRRDPIGVIGLISAWNYPLNVAFRKVAPALVAGNCAILKPSEIAGLSCMFIGKLAQDAGIPGNPNRHHPGCPQRDEI